MPKLENPFLGKLERTKSILGLKLERSATPSNWEVVEEALLEGDVGAATTERLIARAKQNRNGSDEPVKSLLGQEMVKLIDTRRVALSELMEKNHPLVISVVGINGAGKTTTIGKLAHHFKSSGKKVLLGAGDTFRAGAIAQLKMWAERVGVDFVTGREGADPGAVAFDAVSAGKARAMDVVLLDTAGRLHTKSNLMEELKKIHKVVKKVIPEAPHETWLVLDGTLGQNSINQAKEFSEALGVTGLIVTKLDGTSKGGAIFPISEELSLPVYFVGVGESVED
ncbi:signal recognition particle-docking protein FtsY, partial [bacterium]|nr:signal recognition particle-docking protein FtsY [bacterium]